MRARTVCFWVRWILGRIALGLVASGPLAQGWPVPALAQTPGSDVEVQSPEGPEVGRREGPGSDERRTAVDGEAETPLYIEFSYEAPEACMSEAEAFALVQRRSHRVKRHSASGEMVEAPQHLTMAVAQDGAEYRGRLTVRRPGRPPESRSMVGLSCDDLVEGLALTAALSIDPNATVTLGGAEETLEREELPRLAPEVATTRRNGEEPGAEESGGDGDSGGVAPLVVAVGVLGVTEKVMNQTVHVGGGVQLALSGSPGRTFFPLEFRVSIEGLADPRSREAADIFTDVFLVGGAYCPLRLGQPHSFSVCGAVDLGLLMAQSRGFEQSERIDRLYATAAIEGWFRARLTEKVELWLSPALVIPLTERQFAVEPGPEVLSSTVPVGWSGALGVAWRF